MQTHIVIYVVACAGPKVLAVKMPLWPSDAHACIGQHAWYKPIAVCFLACVDLTVLVVGMPLTCLKMKLKN